jgi:mycofactocin system transcriptional regulator
VGTAASTEARVGRPRATSREEIERVALQLFSTRGFDATTVDDIAAAAGIGRRTFFRYFAAKNDVVWGRFAEGLADLRTALARAPENRQMVESLREAIVAFNALAPDEVPVHRQRMSLIFSAPSLQAHSTLMYASWRAVVADFVADRAGVPVEDLLPQLVAHLTLAAAVAAYEQWLADPDADLAQLLDRSVGMAAGGISAATRGRRSRGSASPARGSHE